jgi:hypothetical protein
MTLIFRRQREGDPDETVLAKIAEIGSVLARWFGSRRRRAAGNSGSSASGLPQCAGFLQSLEPLFHDGRRELECGHSPCGQSAARAAVADQSIRLPVEEARKPRATAVTGLAAAVVALVFRFGGRRAGPAPAAAPSTVPASQQQGCQHDGKPAISNDGVFTVALLRTGFVPSSDKARYAAQTCKPRAQISRRRGPNCSFAGVFCAFCSDDCASALRSLC